MSNEVKTLIEMGFSQEKAERALAVTNNKGVEPAMEWLLAHADDVVPAAPAGGVVGSSGATAAPAQSTSEPEPAAATDAATDAAAADAVAKSLKCDECGKLFKSQDEVEFHAAKSGHSSFSESTEEKKPLSDEEKREQLARLEERMREKRKEREEREKAEALEREKLRIKSGRDMQDARLRIQEQEIQKMLEERRRDKLEEQQARDRVRKQIELDRQARKDAAGGGQPADEAPAPAAPAPPAPAPAAAVPKVSYDQARIQLRLPDGRSLAHTFSAKEQLAAVRLYLELNAAEVAVGEFKMMTTFPKKVFTLEDFDKSLDLLGLVPSAVIIVSKGQ